MCLNSYEGIFATLAHLPLHTHPQGQVGLLGDTELKDLKVSAVFKGAGAPSPPRLCPAGQNAQPEVLACVISIVRVILILQFFNIRLKI